MTKMKRRIVFALSICFIFQAFGIVGYSQNQADDNVIVVEQTSVIDTDFSSNIPPEMRDKVIKDGANSVYRVDGKNAQIGDVGVGNTSSDSYAEFDFKLVKSTGVTSGAFSVAPCSSSAAAGICVRFVYVSAIKYNPETKMGDGNDVIRDRIAIVCSSSYSPNKWVYAAISDKELGVQSKSNETPWLRMKAMCMDGVYTLSIYDANGNMLDTLSASAEEVAGENLNSLKPNGCFRITSNSCEVLFDNLKCGNIVAINTPQLKFDTKNAAVNRPVGVSLVDKNEKRIDIDNMIIEADDEAEIEGCTVTYKTTGYKTANTVLYDIKSGEKVTYTADIEIKDNIVYEEIVPVITKDRLYKNEKAYISLYGIDKNGDKFEINQGDFVIEAPDGYLDGNSIYFDKAGIYNATITHGALTSKEQIYVSEYEGMQLNINTHELECGTVLDYAAEAVIDGKTTHLEAETYNISVDKEGLRLSDGQIFADKIGKYTITLFAGGMREETQIDVIEKRKGTMIEEDFEGGAPKNPEYFSWDESQIFNDNGNNVLKIEDEETKFFGGENWKRYTITAKIKIENSVIDERCKYSTFEITPQRQYLTDTSMEAGSGKGGIQCIYRLNHNITGGAHMRVGPAAGERMNIEDGKYHDFKVEVYATQVIFTIDQVTQYYNLLTNDHGYFTFTANNCSVLVDDIIVTKDTTAFGKPLESLSANEQAVEINPYEPMQLRAVNAFRANYTDGSFCYVTNYGTTYSYIADNYNVVEFEQIDGFEYGKVLRKNTIVFNKDAVPGSQITVRAKYQGAYTDFTVKAKEMPQSYIDYAKQSVDIHRENYAFRLVYGFNKGISKSTDAVGTLPHRITIMTVYPKIMDYSNIVNWYAKSAEYEDKFVGRGSDAGDFVILQGMAMYKNLFGIANVSDAAWDAWKNYMCGYRWAYPQDTMSENHKMIYYCTAVLAGEAWPLETMYGGKSGRETAQEHGDYLIDWYNHKLQYGLGEYDSPMYYGVDLFGTELFLSSVKNERLKNLAYDLTTFIYADALSDAIEDNIGGARLRNYHYANYTSTLKSLGFCFNTSTYMTDEFAQMNVQEGQYVLSEYIPPQALFTFAAEKDKHYENKERHQVYTLLNDDAISESIRKYSYITPEYAVGCRVYSEDLSKYRDANYNLSVKTDTWDIPVPIYDHMQEIQWSMNLGNGGDSIITENHPGRTGGHSEWYGDIQCACGKYFQDKGASIGMHKIEKEDELKYTHFYIPRARLQSVEEEQGWIFIHHYDVYAAIKPLKDGKIAGTHYAWSTSDKMYSDMPLAQTEVIINSANTAFVSEVTSKNDFGGSYEEFKKRVLENEQNINYTIANGQYYLAYTTLAGKKIKIDYDQNLRFIDGAQVDFDAYKAFDNPLVQSEWNSGTVAIQNSNSTYKIEMYKKNMSAALAKTLADKIDTFIADLGYAAKVGRKDIYISSNRTNILKCLETINLYEDSYITDVLKKRIARLGQLIDRNMGAEDIQNAVYQIIQKEY